MPLAYQPKDIESYDLKDDEVKLLRAMYDPIIGEFLGIKHCITLITVRNDLQEQFLVMAIINKMQRCFIPREN